MRVALQAAASMARPTVLCRNASGQAPARRGITENAAASRDASPTQANGRRRRHQCIEVSS